MKVYVASLANYDQNIFYEEYCKSIEDAEKFKMKWAKEMPEYRLCIHIETIEMMKEDYDLTQEEEI